MFKLIEITRFATKKSGTMGIIKVAGECMGFTLEDPFRWEKVLNKTSIPDGRYQLRLKTDGRLHEQYKEKFDLHNGMIELANIVGFDGIVIHIGNDVDDTSGCPLVGLSADIQRMKIFDSTKAYEKIYRESLPFLLDNDLNFIQITTI